MRSAVLLEIVPTAVVLMLSLRYTGDPAPAEAITRYRSRDLTVTRGIGSYLYLVGWATVSGWPPPTNGCCKSLKARNRTKYRKLLLNEEDRVRIWS